jgi:beta-mannanase
MKLREKLANTSGKILIIVLPLLVLVGIGYSLKPMNKSVLSAKTIAQKVTPPPTLIPTFTPTPTAIPTNIPKPAHIRFGIAVSDYSNSSGTITSLEQKLGSTIHTISVFKQFGHPTNNTFTQERFAFIKNSGKKLQLTWEPWNPDQHMSQTTDYLKEISEGKQDSYIRIFAQSIKTYGAPVTLRFGHEMNGNWYPWGNRPAEYIAAYRHVHEFFKNEGVSNVTWMWCPNISGNQGELSSYYPGSDIVDEIGIDGFNFATADTGGWKSFSSIFKGTYNFLASNYNKPIVIAETATTGEGGNKETWVRDMFADLPISFPRVKELVWFNYNKEADWRIESSQGSLNAFKDSL